MQQFAARLVAGDERDEHPRRLTWLLRGAVGRHDRHIGALCDVLAARGVDVERWRPRELIEAIDMWHHAAGRATVPPEDQLSPLRYFAWQLAQLDLEQPTPAELASQRRAERAAERRRRAAERAEEQARIDTLDQSEVDRIIAQMKADAAASSIRMRRMLRAGESDVDQ